MTILCCHFQNFLHFLSKKYFLQLTAITEPDAHFDVLNLKTKTLRYRHVHRGLSSFRLPVWLLKVSEELMLCFQSIVLRKIKKTVERILVSSWEALLYMEKFECNLRMKVKKWEVTLAALKNRIDINSTNVSLFAPRISWF